MRPGAGGGKSPPGGEPLSSPRAGGPSPSEMRSGTASCIAFVDVWCVCGGVFYSGPVILDEKGDAAMFRTLKEDLDAVMERDPAARSRAGGVFPLLWV